jgi:peptidoglycan-associated lipoprotein
MRGTVKRPVLFVMGAIIPLFAFASGCAHVKPQEMEDRLAAMGSELRSEIQQGDDRVSSQLGSRIDGLEARMEAQEQALAALERDFNAKIERMETALRFNVPVYFGFDEGEVRAQDFAVLDRFAQVVKDYYPSALITVEGFTDPAGSAAYNLRLGQRRADGVREYLVDRGGLPSDRIRAVSYGEAAPRQVAQGVQGPGEAGWENRRVVLVIDHSGS